MSEWNTICNDSDLTINTGVCALHQGEQVAVFCVGADRELFAVSNYDPIGNANVLSRGIVGSIGEEIVVASPLYKQHFSLRTGICLEDPEHTLKVYSVRKDKGQVQLKKNS